MKRTAVLLLLAYAWPFASPAQKRVATYPFEFEKAFLSRGEYDAYFLGHEADSGFALILRDNKKAEYALLNKKFKVVTKIPADIGTTVFDKALYGYTGGTTQGNQFHFIYNSKSGYQMETVDFDAKAVSHKKLFEPGKAEKPLVSFSEYNRYYAITANDKTGELVFYEVDANGSLTQKSVPFTIPPTAGKQKDKLSAYLASLKLVKSSEQPDLSGAVMNAKLFSYADKLRFVINDKDHPTHIVTLNLPDLSLKETFIDYGDMVPKEEKGKLYINSFEKDNKLYSLLLNRKEIRVAIHDIGSGALLNNYLVNEESGSQLFAQAPLSERRLGKRVDEKQVDDIKKLIKALTKGSEGLMVSENKAGQLIVTVGTYDFIPLSTGGSSGGYTGGWQQGSKSITPSTFNHGATATAISVWNPTMYYRPGSPGYTSTSARYYTTTYFKILLDPATLKMARGRVPTPAADQIKDYIESVDKKAKATNQFSIGKEQYYGYYDRDTKSYVIDQIRIVQ
jgi:hypothetical protein